KALRLIADHGVGNLFTTPTAIRAMMGVSEAAGLDFGNLRLACSAGEPLNPEAIAWWNRTVGCPVLDYYGLSESYPLCGNYPTVEVRPGSMGLPLPGWDVAILDEDEQPVPRGEPGEICLRARSNPHYPLGYWNRPEDSKEVFGGDWFHTKDTARQDEDGYVWYSGRADDVIISAGYRIGPFEVESTLLEHPAVAESAVVGSPDLQRGHVVKAFVRLVPGSEPSDELVSELQRHVRDRLSAYAYPRKVEFVQDLPKTLTGKIRRSELRQADAGSGGEAAG
ncbi:MAG TPA: AMP-binding protein, partial [Actinomycetota bacterium]